MGLEWVACESKKSMKSPRVEDLAYDRFRAVGHSGPRAPGASVAGTTVAEEPGAVSGNSTQRTQFPAEQWLLAVAPLP